MRLDAGGADLAEASEILQGAYRRVAPRYLVERIGFAGRETGSRGRCGGP